MSRTLCLSKCSITASHQEGRLPTLCRRGSCSARGSLCPPVLPSVLAFRSLFFEPQPPPASQNLHTTQPSGAIHLACLVHAGCMLRSSPSPDPPPCPCSPYDEPALEKLPASDEKILLPSLARASMATLFRAPPTVQNQRKPSLMSRLRSYFGARGTLSPLLKLATHPGIHSPPPPPEPPPLPDPQARLRANIPPTRAGSFRTRGPRRR